MFSYPNFFKLFTVLFFCGFLFPSYSKAQYLDSCSELPFLDWIMPYSVDLTDYYSLYFSESCSEFRSYQDSYYSLFDQASEPASRTDSDSEFSMTIVSMGDSNPFQLSLESPVAHLTSNTDESATLATAWPWVEFSWLSTVDIQMAKEQATQGLEFRSSEQQTVESDLMEISGLITRLSLGEQSMLKSLRIFLEQRNTEFAEFDSGRFKLSKDVLKTLNEHARIYFRSEKLTLEDVDRAAQEVNQEVITAITYVGFYLKKISIAVESILLDSENVVKLTQKATLNYLNSLAELKPSEGQTTPTAKQIESSNRLLGEAKKQIAEIRSILTSASETRQSLETRSTELYKALRLQGQANALTAEEQKYILPEIGLLARASAETELFGLLRPLLLMSSANYLYFENALDTNRPLGLIGTKVYNQMKWNLFRLRPGAAIPEASRELYREQIRQLFQRIRAHYTIDSDEDGVSDTEDLCSMDAAKITPATCGCGIAETDSDNDGTPDCNDLCPVSSIKLEPGLCGCEVSDLDNNANGLVDCQESAVEEVSQYEPQYEPTITTDDYSVQSPTLSDFPLFSQEEEMQCLEDSSWLGIEVTQGESACKTLYTYLEAQMNFFPDSFRFETSIDTSSFDPDSSNIYPQCELPEEIIQEGNIEVLLAFMLECQLKIEAQEEQAVFFAEETKKRKEIVQSTIDLAKLKLISGDAVGAVELLVDIKVLTKIDGDSEYIKLIIDSIEKSFTFLCKNQDANKAKITDFSRYYTILSGRELKCPEIEIKPVKNDFKITHLPATLSGWNVSRTEHFVIYHKLEQAKVTEIAQAAEAAWSKAKERWFGDSYIQWTARAELHLYNTTEEYRKDTGNTTNPGFTNINTRLGIVERRQVYLNLGDESKLSIPFVLPHEITHAVLAGGFGTYDVPRWVDEGIAVHQEGEDRLLRSYLPQVRNREQRLLAVSTLMTQDDLPTSSTFHAQSASLVNFFLHKGDSKTFIKFVNESLRAGNYLTALKTYYKINSYEELETEWRRFAGR